MEVWSPEDALRARRYGGMDEWRLDEGVATWSYGAPEVRRGCVDAEVKRSGILEVRCRRVDVEEWRSGGTLQAKQRSAGGALPACRRGTIEMWRSEGELRVCGRGGIDCWSSGSAAAGISMWRY